MAQSKTYNLRSTPTIWTPALIAAAQREAQCGTLETIHWSQLVAKTYAIPFCHARQLVLQQVTARIDHVAGIVTFAASRNIPMLLDNSDSR